VAAADGEVRERGGPVVEPPELPPLRRRRGRPAEERGAPRLQAAHEASPRGELREGDGGRRDGAGGVGAGGPLERRAVDGAVGLGDAADGGGGGGGRDGERGRGGGGGQGNGEEEQEEARPRGHWVEVEEERAPAAAADICEARRGAARGDVTEDGRGRNGLKARGKKGGENTRRVLLLNCRGVGRTWTPSPLPRGLFRLVPCSALLCS
jgi:hypothetical protein